MPEATSSLQQGNSGLLVQNLTLRYGDYTAVNDLSFNAYPGEVLGLLGPNGAGKTSLVKSICGRTDFDDGTIIIDGDVVTYRNVPEGKIGLVPQEIGLYPFLTAAENLNQFARIQGIAKKEQSQAVIDALASVDMLEHRAKRIDEMSGGMKRRINFAAAILNSPKVLILDEPTAGVDVKARDTIHELARLMAKKGMAVILVTHELEQAELICDKLLIMAKGQKVFHDLPDSILNSVYADKKLMMCALRHPANNELSHLFDASGLAASQEGKCWKGLLSKGHEELIEKANGLVDKTGNVLLELGVKKPGLELLLADLVEGKVPPFKEKV